MAVDSPEATIASLTDLSIKPTPTSRVTAAVPSGILNSPILSQASSSAISPPLSDIQNIAYHVSPPTIPTTRTEPLTDRLKRSDPFQFGSRLLEENDDVYAWNAWDHVDPSQDKLFVSYATSQYEFQRAHAASDFDRRRFNAEPEKWWNRFYGNNEANFFKDRKWLRQEFPVLSAATAAPSGSAVEGAGAEDTTTIAGTGGQAKLSPVDAYKGAKWNVILEIGAGAGNTAFPLVRDNQNPSLMIHACDFSSRAVQIIRKSAQYSPKHLNASQWDMAASTLPPGVEPGSVDVVLLIFAFSALAPAQWRKAVQNVWDVLRPGGEVCFRDYGRGDLAQVRFKKGRLLGENFYVRGDGTRVYFFEEEQLKSIWSGDVVSAARQAELGSTEIKEGESKDVEHANESDVEGSAVEDLPAFEVVSLATDRRLLVNRQKQLKMYRCWQQGHFRKSEAEASST